MQSQTSSSWLSSPAPSLLGCQMISPTPAASAAKIHTTQNRPCAVPIMNVGQWEQAPASSSDCWNQGGAESTIIEQNDVNKYSTKSTNKSATNFSSVPELCLRLRLRLGLQFGPVIRERDTYLFIYFIQCLFNTSALHISVMLSVLFLLQKSIRRMSGLVFINNNYLFTYGN